MHHFIPFAIAALIIVAIIIIVPRLQRGQQPINIPRTHASGEANDAGRSIAANCCPLCRDEGGFFQGQTLGVIYCGNSACRAGWAVTNYGNGKVRADLVDGAGDDWLYNQRKVGLTKRS